MSIFDEKISLDQFRDLGHRVPGPRYSPATPPKPGWYKSTVPSRVRFWIGMGAWFGLLPIGTGFVGYKLARWIKP